MWRKHEERVGCGARALIPPGVNAGVRARSSPRLDNQKEPSTHFTFGSHLWTPIQCRSWTLSSKNKCFSFALHFWHFREYMEARLVPCKHRRVGQSLGEVGGKASAMIWLTKVQSPSGKVSRKIPRYGSEASAMVWRVSDQSAGRNPSDLGKR